MLALIPIVCFINLFFIFQNSQKVSSWRNSFLSASMVWGFLATAITECLSMVRQINLFGILGLWSASSLFTLFIFFRVQKRQKGFETKSNLMDIPRTELLFLTSLFIIIIIIGIVGIISPPNNWDSMTYHMSRVVHWIQNGSVANYPTNFLPQLYEGPWAEFAILQFQILSKGDRFANLIQWFSLIGSAIGVSLLARQFGAGLRSQIFAAIFSISLPMGILQGSSTQTDYVVSFWLVCFLYYALLNKDIDDLRLVIAAGIGLGLSILTKPTAYIYAFPFMVWISLSLIKSRRAKGLIQIALMIAIAFIINFGQYTRNYNLFGNPLGPGYEDKTKKYSNDIFTPSSVTSNIIRNLGLHIGTPNTSVNSFFEKEIIKVHQIIGFELNDSRTTWPGNKFHIHSLSFQEDSAGNPLHLLLIVLLTPILILQQRPKRAIFYYIICLIFGFTLFCLYLKWQPWNSRLHLPLFVFWAVPIGILLSKIKNQWAADFCAAILLLGSIPYLLYNQSRPVLGTESIITSSRNSLYFRNRPSLEESYFRTTRFLSNTNCKDIGLMLPKDSYEYPFWILLSKNGATSFRIEHVNMKNISQALTAKYPFRDFTPCAIVMLNDSPPNKIHFKNIFYFQKWSSRPLSIFME